MNIIILVSSSKYDQTESETKPISFLYHFFKSYEAIVLNQLKLWLQGLYYLSFSLSLSIF